MNMAQGLTQGHVVRKFQEFRVNNYSNPTKSKSATLLLNCTIRVAKR